MSSYDYSLRAMQMRRDDQWVYYENEFIRWRHRLDTGELDGAFVINGSNTNLIASPARTIIQIYDIENCTTVDLQRGDSTAVEITERGITCEYQLVCDQGAVTIRHQVDYEAWGMGRHAVTISSETQLKNLFSVQVLFVGLNPSFDCMTWRPILETGFGVWAQNNNPQWIELHHGKRRLDMWTYCSKHIPLSILAMQRGVEGIEFSLGDNLEEWESMRPAGKSSQNAEFIYDSKLKAYHLMVAPYFARQDGLIQGSRTFHFNLTLPLIQRQMAPLRVGGALLLYTKEGVPFTKRWPSDEHLKSLKDSGYSILRIHNDGGKPGDIFWRDAAYPPYPPEEMANMDTAIEKTHANGMKVVPYFSLKELHPEVQEFTTCGEEWARRDEPDSPTIWNRYLGGHLFGVQMCLKSGWYKKRMDTIRTTLANHKFDGVYFDWCMGLECFGKNHCDYWHWDGDEFIDLLIETRKLCGKEGEMYLHTSNVPSLVSENLATILLTEEVEFPAINPQMFTPHVHFLNTASRQICEMLPPTATDTQRKQLALCTLLHHATVVSIAPPYKEVYGANLYWMDTVEKYTRHHAPGEGWTETSDERVGYAYYENEQGERLDVFANLAEEPLTVQWKATRDGRSGEITVPALSIVTRQQ